MSRYIDADILKTKKKHSNEFCENVVSVADIDWTPTAEVEPVVHCQNCVHRGKPTECPFARYEQTQNPHYTTQTTTSPNADYVAQTITTVVDYTSDDDYCSRGVARRKDK